MISITSSTNLQNGQFYQQICANMATTVDVRHQTKKSFSSLDYLRAPPYCSLTTPQRTEHTFHTTETVKERGLLSFMKYCYLVISVGYEW